MTSLATTPVKFEFTSSSKQQFDYIEGTSYQKDGPILLEKKVFHIDCPELYRANQVTFRILFTKEMAKCAWIFRAYLKGSVTLKSKPCFIKNHNPCIALRDH